MFGISYAFGNRGLISVDYERDWYNGMRMKNNPGGGGNEIYNDTFRSWYKGANIVRIGAEFKPLPFLAIRGGFGYMGSMLQDEEQVSAAPMTKQMLYYSAGLGFYSLRALHWTWPTTIPRPSRRTTTSTISNLRAA